MKTSILIFIMGLGFSGNAWSDTSCICLGKYSTPCPSNFIALKCTNYSSGVAVTATPTPSFTGFKPPGGYDPNAAKPEIKYESQYNGLNTKTNTGALGNSGGSFGDHGAGTNSGNTDNSGSGANTTPTPPQSISGSGCGPGRFGGASCETTDAINMGVGVANKLVQTLGSATVQNKGTDAQNNINAKGNSASNADYLNAEADTADAAVKSNKTAGFVQTANSLLQGWRAIAHKVSAGKIGAIECAEGDTSCVEAKRVEAGQQKNKATESTVMAALTVEQASLSFIEAKKAAELARNLREQAKLSDSAQTGQFSMGQQVTVGGDEGTSTNTPTVETGAVTSTDDVGLDGGFKDFNPNIGQDGVLGKAPGEFKEGEQKAGGVAGAGPGGAGGTSASRGDSGDAKQEAAGKPQTGGQYASGDGATTAKGSRGGAGAGVGFDSSLSDLLKKLLPGDEGKKEEQASLALDQDRSPASDQAAVIGRNKNIFIEISKRYQKKNNEGAVIYQ